MKVKILQCSHPHMWYANRVGQEIEVEYVNLRLAAVPDWFVAKTWNWFWKRDQLEMIQREDCEVTDVSGSRFDDGVELGKVLGKEAFRKELVAEGILDPDDDESDDDDADEDDDDGSEA